MLLLGRLTSLQLKFLDVALDLFNVIHQRVLENMSLINDTRFRENSLECERTVRLVSETAESDLPLDADNAIEASVGCRTDDARLIVSRLAIDA
jgi:hypothetical protein